MRAGRAGGRARGIAFDVVLALGAVLTLGVTLALGGCAASGAAVSDPRLDGTWHLASASDNGLGIPIGGSAITLTIGDADHTGGDSPCSSYSATVTGGVGVVYIRAQLTGGTRDDCASPQLNDIEKHYIDALTGSRYAAIDQGSLVLSSANSYLVFVRVAATPIAAIKNSNWRLYALPTQVPAVTSGPGIDPVYLRFDADSGLRIVSGCVTIAASYRIEGENFAVDALPGAPVASGRCTEGDRILTNETALLLDGPLLIDVSSARHDDPATLVITNLDENVPIVWRAAS